MIPILMTLAKVATRNRLQIKHFWTKGYGVRISVYGVIIKVLSCDSNCIADVVIWAKFGNCSISMSHHNLSFIKIWPEKSFVFWEVSWFKFNDVRLAGDSGLEFLHQYDKRVKTKSQKVLRANSYVCSSYEGNTYRRPFCLPTILNKVKLF